MISASALNPTIDQTKRRSVCQNVCLAGTTRYSTPWLRASTRGSTKGGGKSLEIRRFGFNLDHGGVNGGLKVLVNDVGTESGDTRARAGIPRGFENIDAGTGR